MYRIAGKYTQKIKRIVNQSELYNMVDSTNVTQRTLQSFVHVMKNMGESVHSGHKILSFLNDMNSLCNMVCAWCTRMFGI